MQSKGSAVWKGGFKDGRGTISTASGALKQAGYSVGSRFEGGSGTNPEELIAAAHALFGNVMRFSIREAVLLSLPRS